MNTKSSAITGFQVRPYPFEQLRLVIGHRLQVEIPGREERVAARLLGYLKGETLIVRFGPGIALGTYPLGEGDKLGVRGFSGRIAFVFRTMIEKVRYTPYPYCHLQFPELIQGTEIRHAERVRVSMPVMVVGAGGGAPIEATMANVSADGAMLVSSRTLGVVGDRVALTFRFWIHPNEYEVNMRVSAAIQAVANQEDGATLLGTRYGVKFETLRSTESILMQNLIYQRMQENPEALV